MEAAVVLSHCQAFWGAARGDVAGWGGGAGAAAFSNKLGRRRQRGSFSMRSSVTRL